MIKEAIISAINQDGVTAPDGTQWDQQSYITAKVAKEEQKA